MKQLLARVPFTLAGISILVLYLAASALPESPVRVTLLSVVRVLIIPSYLVWLGQSIVSPALGLAPVFAALGFPLTLGLGLVPYVAADWLLSRHRRSRAAAA